MPEQFPFLYCFCTICGIYIKHALFGHFSHVDFLEKEIVERPKAYLTETPPLFRYIISNDIFCFHVNRIVGLIFQHENINTKSYIRKSIASMYSYHITFQ